MVNLWLSDSLHDAAPTESVASVQRGIILKAYRSMMPETIRPADANRLLSSSIGRRVRWPWVCGAAWLGPVRFCGFCEKGDERSCQIGAGRVRRIFSAPRSWRFI